ncbi:MarR family transcriptional regulator, partial [Pseudomonas syringae]
LSARHWVHSAAPAKSTHKRARGLTDERALFEQRLRREQVNLLQRVFAGAGQDAVDGWLTVNRALGQTLQSGACPTGADTE